MACTRALLLLAALLAVANLPAALGTPYTWYNASANYDTYYNVSLDIADMQALAAAGKYAEANAIYRNGKNSYRNIAAGTFRIAYGVATAASRHSGEPYYEAFRAFYKTDTFLDGWLGGALNGTAPEYQNNNFRAASVATYAAVYGWVYILHEVDAGLLYLSGISSPLRNITRSPADAGVETDDAYTLWVGKGPSAPINAARNAARQACLSSSATAAQLAGFTKGLNKALVAVRAAIADTANANNQTYNKAMRAGRDVAVHYGIRGWVQMTLNSLRAATSTSSVAKRAGHQATALASFRAVAPFINAQPKGAHAVERVFNAIYKLKSSSFAQAKAALTSYYAAQNIHMRSIYAC